MTDDVKTMRLRYAGTCAGCGTAIAQGERAHYLRASKTVRCLVCGPAATPTPQPPPAPEPPLADTVTSAPPHPPPPPPPAAVQPVDTAAVELTQGEIPRPATCGDCGRKLRHGTEALHSADMAEVLCIECVTLDTLHSLGTPGAGARREHARRLDRHQTKVRTAHPRLGGLILALSDDPQHVRAWQTGAVGEEEFGRRLSAVAGPQLKVLHDRKVPRSKANIDHLAVTSETIWILDAKRYKGKVETRGHGMFSRRPPDLYVNGRNQMKLVEGVKQQVEVVQSVIAPLAFDLGMTELPVVRGALVFVHAEFGLFSTPFAVDGVWVGWGKALRKRLGEQANGPLDVDVIAKRLARDLRAG